MAHGLGSVRFNRPSLIAVLYLLTWFTGLTAIVGVILAYVWRREPAAEWEQSHWPYLIGTFWIALLGAVLLGLGIAGVILLDQQASDLPALAIALAVILGPAWLIVLLVRCIRVLVAAQAERPLPRPHALLF